ncbi:hypothetical protein V1502_19075 [Bacillus sp. SCS-153A]|uniref:hypothetical protein n=1 Tax=Rossellomorea sedimentorum TaxID=3115294 RepID=UPI0039061E71
MKKFRVEFHFDNENTVSFFIEEERTEATVLHKIFGNDSNHFVFKEDDVLNRIQLNKVTHVAVTEVQE